MNQGRIIVITGAPGRRRILQAYLGYSPNTRVALAHSSLDSAIA